jgi:hypothetical protein
VPVRPALLGAIIGVLGVTAVTTFSNGIADAVTHQSRFGQTFELAVFLADNGARPAAASRVVAATARDPDVAAVNDVRFRTATTAGGNVPLHVFSYEPVGDPLDVVVTSGRMPTSASEVVLGPEASARLGVGVAEHVVLNGSRARTMTVTGLGFVPESWMNSHADGAWVSAGGFDALFDGFDSNAAFVQLRPGAVVSQVRERLTRMSVALTGGEEFPFELAPTPLRVSELRQVRGLPLALGVFMVALALGAVGHVLVIAVRRRRHDLAVLRALGMTGWQSRGVVATQASVLAVVGLAFGVPLGVALGRTLWRAVADYTPLQYVPPTAPTALLLVVPSALLVANLLAAWPGHQAARLRVAHVLRAE